MKHYDIININTNETVMEVKAEGLVSETHFGQTMTDFVGDTNVGILHFPNWTNYKIVEVVERENC